MKRDLIALSILLLIIACFGREILLENRSPYRGDIPAQFYPWKTYVQSSLAAGEIPYWNPFTHGGAPFMANVQSAVFYPLDWILFLFSIERFFGLSLLLHLALGGTGAFWLARKCGATSFPALIAGIAYGLNGFTMIHIPAGNHLTYAGAAWAPWMLWAAAGYVQTQKKPLRWGVIAAGIAFLHFLCGHPQMTFYSLFFSSFFVLLYSTWLHVFIEKKPWFHAALRTSSWMVFLVLGIFLAGFQLLPTLEYLSLANREARLDINMATEFSFAPHRLITLFFPEFYGTRIGRIDGHTDSYVYWSCAYAGILAPFLALVPVALKRHRLPVFFPLALIALAGLFLAWGRGNPFYALWLQLPGFGHFRAPAKYLPYYLTAISTLAALGVEALCANAYLNQQNQSFNQRAAKSQSGAGYIIAAALAAIVALGLGGMWFADMVGAIRQAILQHDISTIRYSTMAYGGTLLLAGLALYLTAKKVPRFPRLAIALLLAAHVAMDLFLFGRMYLHDSNLITQQQIKQATAAPQEIGFISSQEQSAHDGNGADPFRVMTLKDIDIANLFIHWKTGNIAGYDPMSLRTYNAALAKSEGWNPGEMRDNILLSNPDSPTLDQLNVNYVLTQQTLDDPGVKRVFSSNDFHVYQRTSETIAWARAAERGRESFSEPDQWRPIDETIHVSVYEPQRIDFTIEADQPLWVKVSEWDYPNWQVRLLDSNGISSKTDMASSQDGFRVIAVPQGKWTVSQYYSPSWSGWLLSLFAAGMLALILGVDNLIQTGGIFKLAQQFMGRNF